MKNIICKAMESVKGRYPQIYSSVEFGAYIEPGDYFVSYIFATDRELTEAYDTGLTEKINEYHKEKLLEYGYPEKSVKDCVFASQEECNREYSGNWYYYYK